MNLDTDTPHLHIVQSICRMAQKVPWSPFLQGLSIQLYVTTLTNFFCHLLTLPGFELDSRGISDSVYALSLLCCPSWTCFWALHYLDEFPLHPWDIASCSL